MDLKNKIRNIKDYPKKGIIFRDVTTLLKDKEAFNQAIDELCALAEGKDIDYIAGIDARGFIIGGAMAYKMGCGFIPVRKPGKLPFEKIRKEYALEYGNDALEIHKDAAEKGAKVLVIDDLLATGGTAGAACELLEDIGAKVEGAYFIVELVDLKGRDTLNKYEVKSLLKYEGE